MADFEGVTTVAIAAGAAQDAAGTGNDAASAEFAVDTRAPTVHEHDDGAGGHGSGHHERRGGVPGRERQQNDVRRATSGQPSGRRAASERHERVNRALLGPAGAALSAGTLAAIGDRIDAVGAGAALRGRLRLGGPVGAVGR